MKTWVSPISNSVSNKIGHKETSMSDERKRDSTDTFVHDISSPLLIINLATEELEEYVSKNPEAAKQLNRLVEMVGKNLKKVNEMIAEFREIRRKERSGS